MRSYRQNTDSHTNKVCQLELQPTIVANGDVHNDNLNNCNGNLEEQKTNDDKDQPYPLQYIIIDMAPVTFIDSCGSKMLERVSIYTHT